MKNKFEVKARALALMSRKLYGNLSEPVDPYKVLAFFGISCVKKPLSGQISGMYVRGRSARVVLVNSCKSVGHQNFTLAHELYHAEHESGLEMKVCQKVGGFNATNESEILADFFAAHFLMPEEGVRQYLDKRLSERTKVELGDVIFLEQIYGVSHLSMLNRLSDLGVISAKEKQIMLPGVTRNALILGYEDTLYKPSNEVTVISEFAEKSKLALDNDLITFSRYEELLAEAGLNLAVTEEVQDFVD